MTTTKALAKLYKAIVGSEGRNSAAKILSDLADNWATGTVATASKAGMVKQGAYVADAASSPTKAEFNALVKSLKDAGIISSSAPT